MKPASIDFAPRLRGAFFVEILFSTIGGRRYRDRSTLYPPRGTLHSRRVWQWGAAKMVLRGFGSSLAISYALIGNAAAA
jgi:hypothetical protein